MKKIFIVLALLLITSGVVVWGYLECQPVKFDILLANGDKMSITYEEFDEEYTKKNNLEVFYGAKFTFKDRIDAVEENVSIDAEPGETEAGALIRFKSGMTLFVSRKNEDKYNEKMKDLKEGKKVKITTYFTEKSNRGSFPMPTLMPYMDFENLDYDYSKLIIE